MKTTVKDHDTYTRITEQCWQYQVLVKIRALEHSYTAVCINSYNHFQKLSGSIS